MPKRIENIPLFYHALYSLTTSKQMKHQLSGAKGTLLPVSCDVTKEQEVISAFERAVKEFGKVDVLVNNAGLAFPEPLLSGDTERWRRVLEVSIVIYIRIAF